MNRRVSTFAIFMIFRSCVCSMDKEYDGTKGAHTFQQNEKETLRKSSLIKESILKLYNKSNDPFIEAGKQMKESKVFDKNLDYDYYGNEFDSSDEHEAKAESNDYKDDSEKNIDVPFTASSGKTCKVCRQIREDDKKRRLQLITETILTKLGFFGSKLPNISGKIFPHPPSILNLIEQHGMQSDMPHNNDDDISPEDVNPRQIQRAFMVAQKPPASFNISVPGACHFELPTLVKSRHIQDATMWIYLKRPQVTKTKFVEVFLYKVPENALPQHILKGPVLYMLTSSYEWLQLKIVDIVHRWMKHANANCGVVIQALDADGHQLAVTPEDDQHNQFFPVLEVVTKDYHDKHRRKRSSEHGICTEDNLRETCCRYPLEVNFTALGWDWIVWPKTYLSNYCAGECQFRHMDNSPHTYIFQQSNSSESGLCCSPSKYMPLSMLYYDHKDNILLTKMEKMVVDKCACA